MITRAFFSILTSVLFLPIISYCQSIEKITFDVKDSKDGYYFAIQSQLKISKGVLVLLSSFMPPGGILPEAKLHTWFMQMICSPLLIKQFKIFMPIVLL